MINWNRNKMGKRAFTLIELLVVISIVGILSSVVLASLQNARKKGTVGAGKTFAGHTRGALFDNSLFYFNFDGASITSLHVATVPNTGVGLVTVDCNSWTSHTNANCESVVSFPDDTSLFNRGKHLLIANNNSNVRPIRVTSQDVPSTLTSKKYTAMLWYKPLANQIDCADGVVCHLLGSHEDSSSVGLSFSPLSIQVIKNATGISTVRAYYDTNASPLVANVNITSQDWIHIAFSVEGGGGAGMGKAILYINGTALDTETNFTNSAGTNDSIVIGGGLSNRSAKGYYDDVAFYTKPLIASEVRNVYLAGLEEHSIAQK